MSHMVGQLPRNAREHSVEEILAASLVDLACLTQSCVSEAKTKKGWAQTSCEHPPMGRTSSSSSSAAAKKKKRKAKKACAPEVRQHLLCVQI